MAAICKDSCSTEERPPVWAADGCEDAEGIVFHKFDSSTSYKTALSDRAGNILSTSTFVSVGNCGFTGEGTTHLDVDCQAQHRTNLNHYHAAVRFSKLDAPGHFTMVRTLRDCVGDRGKIELRSWQRHQVGNSTCDKQLVVVKRVPVSRVFENVQKETCERAVLFNGHERFAEDTLSEIGVYSYLAQQQDLPEYLLKMHTAFQTADDVWLVLEHADGGELYNFVESVADSKPHDLSGCDVLERSRVWMWQLLHAVDYLHKHKIGHRDISIENVLLCGGSIRLMDFGQSVQTHSSTGVLLRYFSALGKPYYRPPECNIPNEPRTEVTLQTNAASGEVAFANTVVGGRMCEVMLSEDGVAGQRCFAEPWGYAVPPVDVFACGVCFFLLTTGMPPWRETTLQDLHFKYVHTHGIQRALRGWGKSLPSEMLDLMVHMMKANPLDRPSASECLADALFKDLHAKPVPLHPLAVDAPTSGEEDYLAASLPPDEVLSSGFEFTGCIGDPYSMEDSYRCVPDPFINMSTSGVIRREQPSAIKPSHASFVISAPKHERKHPAKPAVLCCGRRHTDAARSNATITSGRVDADALLRDTKQKLPAINNSRRASMPRLRLPVGSALNAAKSRCKSPKKSSDNDF